RSRSLDKGHAALADRDPRAPRLIRRIAATLGVVVSFLVIGAPRAAALNCDWTATSTDATVNADLSMDVVEAVTYDFDAGCHGGICEIDAARVGADDSIGTSQYDVGRMTVTEHGESVPIAEEHAGFVKWGSPDVTVSGRHIYEISYHVDHAVALGPDVGVLDWHVVGTPFPQQHP